MTGTAQWFPFYIADYQADTMHLTRDQHGAYFLLLLAYYRRGKPLPDDNHYLAGVVKAGGRTWRYLRPIMAPFFQIEGGWWRHKRIDAELAAQGSQQEARSQAARGNANKRWQKSTKSTAEPMPAACQPHSSTLDQIAKLAPTNLTGLIDSESNEINYLRMLQSQSQSLISNEINSPPPFIPPPLRGRGKKRLSPIEGIAKGFADALAERARNRQPDHPAAGALLDGAGAGSVTPLARRRLA